MIKALPCVLIICVLAIHTGDCILRRNSFQNRLRGCRTLCSFRGSSVSGSTVQTCLQLPDQNNVVVTECVAACLQKKGESLSNALECQCRLGRCITTPTPTQQPNIPAPPAGTPAGGTPAGGTPAGGTPAGGTPAGGTPAGGTPAGGTPAGGTPAGGTPAGGTPAGGTPAGGTPAGGTPAGGTPAGGTPAGGTPAGGTPAGGTPAGGTPSSG